MFRPYRGVNLMHHSNHVIECKDRPDVIEEFQYLQTQWRNSLSHQSCELPHRVDQNAIAPAKRSFIPPTWQTSHLTEPDDYDILVIPSLTLDQQELQKVEGVMHYEERMLFSLIRLKNPRTRLVYVTSEPLPEIIIDYYLHLLPGIPFSHARDRLLLFSAYDRSCKSLTEKILDRPRLIERIRRSLRSPRSYMVCFNSTSWERELSVRLQLPLFACDPNLLYWGTKSGSREIFAQCNIPHPDGCYSVWNSQDLAEASAELWERQPHLKRMVIKLNEGFSGEGNALLHLNPIADYQPGKASHGDRVRAIKNQFQDLRFQGPGENWPSFSSRIPELGAIVEAFIEGDKKRSPSVQAQITPLGTVEILSTHDQILGGPDGQIYLGCQFPADEAYRLKIQKFGRLIGQNLAEKGALERFAVDFIVVPSGDKASSDWDVFAIEINLRCGGTTHPFMTLQYLTGGFYNSEDGLFYSQKGRPKYYLATDNLKNKRYQGLLPHDLIDIIAHHNLHFDTGTETGTVFHLMGTLSEFGKLGLTNIGDSLAQCELCYQNVISVLDQETQLYTGTAKTPISPQSNVVGNPLTHP